MGRADGRRSAACRLGCARLGAVDFASLGIITGALFLMPAVTAFVGSFFVDEVGEAVEREYYSTDPAGSALPFLLAFVEGVKVAVWHS